MERARESRNQAGEFYGISFWCAGCSTAHYVPTKNGTQSDKGWDWNGSLERPTLSPSVLVHEAKEEEGLIHMPRCHSYVRDGRIEYLADCGHSLAGQTIDLESMESY